MAEREVSPESGDILADLAEKNNVTYMLGYHKRSDPAMEYAWSLIREWKGSGEFGRMRMVRTGQCHELSGRGAGRKEAAMRTERSSCGSSHCIRLHSHEIRAGIIMT